MAIFHYCLTAICTSFHEAMWVWGIDLWLFTVKCETFLPSWLWFPVTSLVFSLSALLSACPAFPGTEVSGLLQADTTLLGEVVLTTAPLLSSCSAEHGRPGTGTDLRWSGQHRLPHSRPSEKELKRRLSISGFVPTTLEFMSIDSEEPVFSENSSTIFYITTGFNFPSWSTEERRGQSSAHHPAQEREETLQVGLANNKLSSSGKG